MSGLTYLLWGPSTQPVGGPVEAQAVSMSGARSWFFSIYFLQFEVLHHHVGEDQSKTAKNSYGEIGVTT